MTRIREAHWQFACPECGFGDLELGELAADHEIHCIVCLEETGRHVLLDRWLPAKGEADHERLHDLAAA
jgi:hypothetical protein